MKNKSTLLIYTLIASCAVFVYLTYHHFSVQLGMEGSALCELGSKLSCDAAALSSYSELFGIPMAVLGLSFNLILLGITVFYQFGWAETTPFSEKTMKVLFVCGALTSVIMGVVSVLFVGAACPFCIVSYILSFIALFLAFKVFSATKGEKCDCSDWTQHKPLLSSIIAIPILAWFISGIISDNYGLDEIKKYLPEKISQWQHSPVYEMSNTLGLIAKPSSTAKATLVEFADFKCPHCKSASESIHKFLKSRNDVEFVFKPFPLDGSCNPVISMKGDNSRCVMAAWTLCAEKMAQKGWEIHDLYFQNQSNLIPVSDLSSFNQKAATDLGLDYDAIESCSKSEETLNTIASLGKEAEAARVEGTPTIFLNGKRLPLGQRIEVLKEAFKHIK